MIWGLEVTALLLSRAMFGAALSFALMFLCAQDLILMKKYYLTTGEKIGRIAGIILSLPFFIFTAGIVVKGFMIAFCG